MKQDVGNNGSIEQPHIKERSGRGKMPGSHKAAYESMQAGLKPPGVIFEIFMGEVDLLATHKKHGRQFDQEVELICTRFEKAFADNDIDRMVELYDELEAIKIKAAFLPA